LSDMTDARCGAGTTYLSGAPEFTPSFSEFGRYNTTQKTKASATAISLQNGVSSVAPDGHDASDICIDVTPFLPDYQAELCKSTNS